MEQSQQNHRYSRHDWRLFKAVKNRKPLRDGIISVYITGKFLNVKCYGNIIFRYDMTNGFWEAATWGAAHGWLQDKLNACLHAVNSDIRVYREGKRLNIVQESGRSRWFKDSFNSEEFK